MSSLRFPDGTETLELTLDNGLRMRAYARGTGPRTVVLLHGFPELAYSWRDQLAAVPTGFRFVAPDLRGYGGSDAPKRVREYRIDALVGDIAALLRALHMPQADIVGHDWGGVIAWELARRKPELVRTLTILNCPPSEMLVRELWRNRAQLKKSWYVFFFQLPLVPDLLYKLNAEKLIIAGFRKIAINKAIFTRETLAPYIDQARRGMRGLNYYRASFTALADRSRPPLIQAPTRLIWGVGDGALGPWFLDPERYRRVASHFDIVRVEEAGHWVQQEAPVAVNEALIQHLMTN